MASPTPRPEPSPDIRRFGKSQDLRPGRNRSPPSCRIFLKVADLDFLDTSYSYRLFCMGAPDDPFVDAEGKIRTTCKNASLVADLDFPNKKDSYRFFCMESVSEFQEELVLITLQQSCIHITNTEKHLLLGYFSDTRTEKTWHHDIIFVREKSYEIHLQVYGVTLSTKPTRGCGSPSLRNTMGIFLFLGFCLSCSKRLIYGGCLFPDLLLPVDEARLASRAARFSFFFA